MIVMWHKQILEQQMEMINVINHILQSQNPTGVSSDWIFFSNKK